LQLVKILEVDVRIFFEFEERGKRVLIATMFELVYLNTLI
jgi:hypothetical protein